MVITKGQAQYHSNNIRYKANVSDVAVPNSELNDSIGVAKILQGYWKLLSMVPSHTLALHISHTIKSKNGLILFTPTQIKIIQLPSHGFLKLILYSNLNTPSPFSTDTFFISLNKAYNVDSLMQPTFNLFKVVYLDWFPMSIVCSPSSY